LNETSFFSAKGGLSPEKEKPASQKGLFDMILDPFGGGGGGRDTDNGQGRASQKSVRF